MNWPNNAIMKPLPANSPSGGFPRFDDGDIFIFIHPDLPIYQYRLHSLNLYRFSEWFVDKLKGNVDEASEALKFARTNADARFDLRYNPVEDAFQLNRTVSRSLVA
jgi:hypothetical protein